MRLLVIQNITQIHNLEQMRSEFIASTSHELRTPLTVITGYLEALQEIGTMQEHGDVIHSMLIQARRMESIIRDMLQLTKLESLQNHKERSRRPVDIVSLLKQVYEDALTVDASVRNITLDMDEHINILGSEQELRSAFSNLVQNAIRYTAENSSIRITWKERNNGTVRYMVEDNGPGISAEHIPRLTERFYRVDVGRSRDKGGTGLGLAIVKQVMKQHDGQLLIESKPGMGSRFICEFPQHLVLNQLRPQIKAVS
jgi:two-component system phosphate regulon sensor histidine kinase PhoR